MACVNDGQCVGIRNSPDRTHFPCTCTICSRYKQFIELSWEIVDAVWDVQVAGNEGENHPDVGMLKRWRLRSAEATLNRLRDTHPDCFRTPEFMKTTCCVGVRGSGKTLSRG